jgi:MFS family permease
MEAQARPSQAPPAVSDPWPPAHTAWYALGVLSVVRLSAQLDLGILSLLVEPIKQEMGLSDGQLGLLLGFAFASLYLALGVPLARFVDRYSRRAILAVGVGVWSLMTALTGLANSYWQFFACRVGVGAGESVNGPATFSLIADYFPRERLARAIAFINLGSIAGTGLSLLLGAVVIDALARMTMPVLPLIGQPKYWQMVFFIVGLPGLLLAVLMMTVPEPKRRGLKDPDARESVPFAGVLAFLALNWRFFLPMFAGLMISATESGGTQMWRPAFYQRTYDWSPQLSGYVSGIVQLVAAPIGLFLGAWLSEHFAKRNPDANLRVVVIAWSLATPLIVLGPLMPTGELAAGCSAVALLFSMMGAPTQNAALQSVTPSHLRGQVTALYLLTFVLAGQGVGPSFIAAITEWIVRDEAGLRYALAGSAAVMMPLAVMVMLLGMRPYGAEIARIRTQEAFTHG